MKDLLTFIATGITGPETVVSENIIDGVTVYTIQAPKEKVGYLIGKEGKTIKAIRTILSIKSNLLQSSPRYSIKIEEK